MVNFIRSFSQTSLTQPAPTQSHPHPPKMTLS